MAIPASLITNLSLGGIGLVSAGGLAYGGYELLKDRPRAMSEFLNTKNKIALSQEGDKDTEEWKESWTKYMKKYSPPEKRTAKPKATKESPEVLPEKEVVQEKEIEDIWGLKEEIKTKSQIVPQKFKEKCKEEGKRNISGIWTKGFDDYLEYCTKDNPEAY